MPDRFAPQDPRAAFAASQPGVSLTPTMPAQQRAGQYMDGEAMRNALEALVSGLQGASNSAAQYVTMPVDGINALLQAAGLPVSQMPVGGEDWMRAHGLMRDPANPVAGQWGEAAGLLAPAGAMQRIGRARNALSGLLDK